MKVFKTMLGFTTAERRTKYHYDRFSVVDRSINSILQSYIVLCYQGKMKPKCRVENFSPMVHFFKLERTIGTEKVSKKRFQVCTN